jgi:hypothetical protein
MIADDPAVAVTALAVDLVTEFDGDTAYADAALDVAADTGAPLAVLTSIPSAIDRATAELLRDNGIAVLEGASSGLAALGHLAAWPLTIDHSNPGVDQARRDRWLRQRADWIRAWPLTCWPTTASGWRGRVPRGRWRRRWRPVARSAIPSR